MAHSMVGDCASLREADEGPRGSLVWTPGVDFDPTDPDEMEIMHLVWGREQASRVAALQRENQRLRERLAEVLGDDEY